MHRIFNNANFIAALFIGSLILTGCKEQKLQVKAPRGPVEVEVVTIQPRAEKLSVELPGRTTAFRVAEVRPQVSGILQKRLFEEGSEVTAGQLLYQIDPAIYLAQHDSAKAALEKARATEQSARLKAERYKNLVKTKAVSELDQVDAEASWKQAVADIASAEAALNSARINLEYTRIVAPISGHIGKSLISEGALVTAQQSSALATIQQLDPIYVDMTQSSTMLRNLKKDISPYLLTGDSKQTSNVTILFDDGSSYKQLGSLQFSDVTVEQSTGTITLRAIVANPDQELLPGMFVRARIDKGIRENAIFVPSAAISRNNKGQAVVMITDRDSKVQSRIVTTGQVIREKTLVTEGLGAGEKVIVAGLQNIKAGSSVIVVEQQKASLAQIGISKATAAGRN